MTRVVVVVVVVVEVLVVVVVGGVKNDDDTMMTRVVVVDASTLARDEVSKMIKEAEENATFDKSRKALVNITYELDNLLLKSDILFQKFILEDTSEKLYFSEVLKEIKTLYKQNRFKSISSQKIDNLKYAYSLLVLSYFKTELAGKSSSGNGKNGTVIDITGS